MEDFSCNIPDNTFSGLDNIVLPEGLKDDVISETEFQLMDCFIDSLGISSASEFVTDAVEFSIKQLWLQEFRSIQDPDSEVIHEYLLTWLDILKDVNLREYTRLYNDNSQSYIVINGVSINFHNSLSLNDIWIENMTLLFDEGLLSIQQVYEILEWDEWFQEDENDGFSLWDAIVTFGISPDLERDIRIILERDVWVELDSTEYNNLINMLRYFLYIESSGWYNVANYEWISSAQWYFQYLTRNGRFLREELIWQEWHNAGRWQSDYEETSHVRRVWGNSSFETGLLRIPGTVIESRPDLQNQLALRWLPEYQNIMSLRAEDQIILFLSDLIERPWVNREHIMRMLRWDVEAVEELYRLHHTNTDNETEVRMLFAAQEIYGREIHEYTREWDSVRWIILPWVNMTWFFHSLISELNPNTWLSHDDVMQSLTQIENIRFQAWWTISISRSQEEWYAYIMRHNDRDYMKVSDEWDFIYLY